MKDIASYPKWIEIDLDQLKSNYEAIEKAIKYKSGFLGVVKANAYGHGAVEVAETLVEGGVSILGVSSISEALEIRRTLKKVDLLILGYVMEAQIKEAIENNFIMSLFSLKQAEYASKICKKMGGTLRTHIKIDTGMNRVGIQYDEAIVKVKDIKKLPNLAIEGIFSHFATSDEKDSPFMMKQYERFKKVLNQLEAENIKLPCQHICNSGGVLSGHSSLYMDLVRPGILLYGHYPSDDLVKSIPVKPVMTFKSKITHIKTLHHESGISYGLTYTGKAGDKIATVPVGYGDGYPRGLSNSGHILVRGQKMPIVGKICMDQLMIDVTSLPDVSLEEEVVLMGGWPGSDTYISAEEIGKTIGHTTYELMCMVARRVPRVYIKKGQISKIKDYLSDKTYE